MWRGAIGGLELEAEIALDWWDRTVAIVATMKTRDRSPLERNPEAFKNLFSQINETWIQPEILRRKQNGTLDNDFRIKKCKILLGNLLAPTILFNKEAGWLAQIEPDLNKNPIIGMDISLLHDVKDIKAVDRPLCNGLPTSFIYLTRTMSGYSIIVDIIPDGLTLEEEQARWDEEAAPLIIETLKNSISEVLISGFDHSKLKKIGLWLAPALVPYPLAKILKLLENDNSEAARNWLVQHCTSAFLEERIRDWYSISAYGTRRTLFEAALEAHREKKYQLSIHAIIPQVEGVISDFLHSLPDSQAVPFWPVPKIIRFKDVLLAAMQRNYLYVESVKSSVEFMIEVMLQGFTKWFGPVHENQFPMRHAVVHGKYDDSVYSEENSIKLFLILDTLHNYMKLYSQFERPVPIPPTDERSLVG